MSREAYKWKDGLIRVATEEREPMYCDKCRLRVYTELERGRKKCTECEQLD